MASTAGFGTQSRDFVVVEFTCVHGCALALSNQRSEVHKADASAMKSAQLDSHTSRSLASAFRNNSTSKDTFDVKLARYVSLIPKKNHMSKVHVLCT